MFLQKCSENLQFYFGKSSILFLKIFNFAAKLLYLKRGYANFCFHLKLIRHDSNTRQESPSGRTAPKNERNQIDYINPLAELNQCIFDSTNRFVVNKIDIL